MPAPGQQLSTAEDLRQLASRCLNHPDSLVNGFNMEPGAAGFYNVVIVFTMPNALAVTTAEDRF